MIHTTPNEGGVELAMFTLFIEDVQQETVIQVFEAEL